MTVKEIMPDLNSVKSIIKSYLTMCLIETVNHPISNVALFPFCGHNPTPQISNESWEVKYVPVNTIDLIIIIIIKSMANTYQDRNQVSCPAQREFYKVFEYR